MVHALAQHFLCMLQKFCQLACFKEAGAIAYFNFGTVVLDVIRIRLTRVNVLSHCYRRRWFKKKKFHTYFFPLKAKLQPIFPISYHFLIAKDGSNKHFKDYFFKLLSFLLIKLWKLINLWEQEIDEHFGTAI